MEYRKMGRTGLKVSAFCLGTMMFGRQVKQQESLRIIHKAIDEGVNFIDTADMYSNGVTEQIVGKAIKGRKFRIGRVLNQSRPLGNGARLYRQAGPRVVSQPPDGGPPPVSSPPPGLSDPHPSFPHGWNPFFLICLLNRPGKFNPYPFCKASAP